MTTLKVWLCGSQQTMENASKDGNIRPLYLPPEKLAHQKATVRTGHGTTDWSKIGKGVHQGYILSAYLCYSYEESVQFSIVTQSCPTLCDPVDWSTPGLPVHHQHVYPDSYPLSRWCHPTISSSIIPYCSHLQYFPASRSFQKGQFFASGGQSTGGSASTSALPMNTQDWSPLGWTDAISLQSKGLSRVFSNTTVQKHQFFGAQLSL